MDGTRQLDAKGIKQSNDMAKWLVGQIGRVDIVICSPFARGMQTAQIMAKALGAHVADSKMLEPDGKPEEMWKEIERLAQQSKDVLVVGHDPSLNALLLWLCDLNYGKPESDPPEVRFEHAAIAHVTVLPSPRLRWLVDPKLVIDADQDELEEAALALADQIGVELHA